MRSFVLASVLIMAAACGQNSTSSSESDTVDTAATSAATTAAMISEAEKTDIDCLAATTVKAITDTIREGAAAGTDPAELRDVPATETAKAVEQLATKYAGAEYAAYLQSDITYRLEQIQNAINNRDPNSDAHGVMNDTFALADSCTFGSD